MQYHPLSLGATMKVGHGGAQQAPGGEHKFGTV
jgi:hypothetical protein